MLTMIKQESITEQVAECLRKAIDDRSFKAGERLTEQEVCRLMNVSRTPVREAFRVLQVEGYLTHKPRYGVVIAELNEKEIDDVWEVRIHLEELIARKTARLADEEIKARIRAELFRIGEALKHKELEDETINELDQAYFSIHIDGCGNRKLQEIAHGLRLNSALIRRKPGGSGERRRACLKEIVDLYTAYLDNDEDRAVECIRTYFNASLAEIKSSLD